MPEQGTGPGTYLIYKTKEGPVHYVGRSDTNLKKRIESEGGKCPNCGVKVNWIKWWDFSTKKEAFLKECKEWHKQDNLCNEIHPDKPNGTTYKCPIPHV